MIGSADRDPIVTRCDFLLDFVPHLLSFPKLGLADDIRTSKYSDPACRRESGMEIAPAVSSRVRKHAQGHSHAFRQIVGSRATALETLLVLRQVISKSRFSNMEQLVTIIRSVGRRLVEAQPKGSDVSTRTIRRRLIREWNRALCWKYCAQSIAPYTGGIPHSYERNGSDVVE
jgi:translation initiation factor 2B subunit (eIF-2B alpha/beta/delta family)